MTSLNGTSGESARSYFSGNGVYQALRAVVGVALATEI